MRINREGRPAYGKKYEKGRAGIDWNAPFKVDSGNKKMLDMERGAYSCHMKCNYNRSTNKSRRRLHKWKGEYYR